MSQARNGAPTSPKVTAPENFAAAKQLSSAAHGSAGASLVTAGELLRQLAGSVYAAADATEAAVRLGESAEAGALLVTRRCLTARGMASALVMAACVAGVSQAEAFAIVQTALYPEVSS